MNSTASLLIFSPHHDPGLLSVLHYLTPSSLGRALPVTRSVYPSVSLLQSNAKGGTGISTSCPSPTTFVLVLGFSPRLPVSVCGTGILSLPSSFSRQCEFNSFLTCFQSPSQPRLSARTSLRTSLTAWPESTIPPVCLSFCVTASVLRLSTVQEYQPVVHRLRLLSSA